MSYNFVINLCLVIFLNKRIVVTQVSFFLFFPFLLLNSISDNGLMFKTSRFNEDDIAYKKLHLKKKTRLNNVNELKHINLLLLHFNFLKNGRNKCISPNIYTT